MTTTPIVMAVTMTVVTQGLQEMTQAMGQVQATLSEAGGTTPAAV